MSITIQVPDGRRVELPTDDLEVAKKAAANWAVQNPAPEIDATELQLPELVQVMLLSLLRSLLCQVL